MTTDTEALRAQFEHAHLNEFCEHVQSRWVARGGYYKDEHSYDFTDEMFRMFRAGHAAAKAETAVPVVGRWYFVTNDGAATLCADEADAKESAAEADIEFPRMAPHRVTQLVPVDQAAVRTEHAQAMDVLRQIAAMPRRTREQKLASSCVQFLEAIRAGAKGPSYAAQ